MGEVTQRWKVEAWPTPAGVATVAVDSRYAETFWLPTLGPSALWMLRRLNRMIGETTTDTFLSAAVGLGHQQYQGQRSAYNRTMSRLEQFKLVVRRQPGLMPHGTIAVRTALPPLSDRNLERLPPELQTAHRRLFEECPPPERSGR